jgi:hypothetical protein
MMRDVCEFENDKLGALGRMRVSGWILIINQNDFLDRSSWMGLHGQFLMEKSSCKRLLDGQVLMDRSSWIGPHGQVLMDRSSWTVPHGHALMGRNVIVCWTCELYMKVNEHIS